MANRTKTAAIAANRARVRKGTLEQPSEKFHTVDEKRDAPEAKPTERARKTAATKNFADPATQWQILNPEVMRYVLRLPEGNREIEIKTAFSLGDIHDRRIFEDMQSFRMLVVGQARRLAQDDQAVLASDSSLLSAALLRSIVREEARAIIVKIARFTDVDGNATATLKPTIEQLIVGMNPNDIAAFSMYLLNRVSEEELNQKNGVTAAPK